ncbi:MAG: addiction module protein [Verrucomicrobia bacterium]|nr:addiction module protein [Verrucomicrobiota bacterium]
MALTNLTIAEEALSLPPEQRVDLAQLLIESLADDPRSDTEIKDELACRLEALRSGEDAGLNFQQVFGTSA